MATRMPQPVQSGGAGLGDISQSEIVRYLYDLLMGAERIAQDQGLEPLASQIAAATSEAAILLLKEHRLR